MRLLPVPFQKAVETVHWSIQDQPPPLFYQSLEELSGIRQQTKDADSAAPLDFLNQDLAGTVTELFETSNDSESTTYFGWIATALVCLGHGWTDECHNLVTPLSWPDDIHFAHTPSQYSKASPTVRSYATYVHAMVHRKEGFNAGEFGMMGLANAYYWGSAFAKSPAAGELPHDALFEAVQALVEQHEDHHPVIRQWWQDHFPEDSSVTTFFDPRSIHALVATVWHDDKDNSRQQSALRAFAEQVATTEVRILLQDVLHRAGYSITTTASSISSSSSTGQVLSSSTVDTDPVTTPTATVNAEVALRAARRVSIAHISNFQSSGAIVLRKLLSNTEADEKNDVLSVAAGVACRLLHVPACRVVVCEAKTRERLQVVVAVKPADYDDDLQPGDVRVVQVHVTASVQQDTEEGRVCFSLEATTADDPTATYVDPLFDKRGDTPTTVVQWSKGTIF